MKITPEPYLNEAAKEYFYRIVNHLDGLDAMKDVDSFGISMMAFDLWLFHESAAIVSETGGKQTTQSGYSQITADITIMEKSKASFLKYSEKFGLSPKDREKMIAFKGRKKADAFDKV